MPWVGGTIPSPGMLACCLGPAANFANDSSRVLSLQLLGAATHGDPPRPTLRGDPGPAPAPLLSLPGQTQPREAASGFPGASVGN